MKDEILFGAAYYLEYMPEDRLEEDIKMMKHIGMNVVRIAESTWSTLEPREGEYNFHYIDRVLEVAKREDMKVIIGTPTYAIPAWMVRKCPEVMVTNDKGRASYGRRQIMDIMNPYFRERAQIVIEKLMEHVADQEMVIGYQIDNETKYYGTSSEVVQKLFVKHCKEKYKTTEALNDAFHLEYWSNSIHDWDDFPNMDGCINAGLASEYDRFRRNLAADYLKWQSELVANYARKDQFITHNFDFEWKKFGADIAQDGYSYGVQPDINHYEASESVTIAGTDIYHPTQDELTGAEIAFGGDSIRSLKWNNYLVLECQAQAFKYWTPYPGQLRLHGYSHLASGAAGVMYWNWHSIHNGYETYWKGLLSHDLLPNPTYDEAGIMGNEWKNLTKDNLIVTKKNKVALVVDSQSMNAFGWFPIDKDLSYNDVVRYMYDSLYEMNVECDIVDVNAICLGDYKMVVTPALYSVTPEKIKEFDSFVEEGGVLISSFKSFVADDNLTVYHDVQPHGMTECFGMSYNQFTEPGTTTLKGQEVTYFAELLKVEKAECLARYEHKYWGKYAGITRNQYGKGTAFYLGCYTSKDILKQIYDMALSAAKLAEEIPEASFPIIVRSGVNPGGEKLHYILHYSEEIQKFICPYDNVTDILTKTCYHKGDEIILKDWDVVILKEHKGEAL